MNEQKRKSFVLGLIGLILIVIILKYLPVFVNFTAQKHEVIDKPVILFFNEDEPCECMVGITEQAEQQILNWSTERHDGIPILRIAMEQRKDLEVKYKVFRVPCLLLIDTQDQITWRQDYPLIEGGPFKLDELEVAIAELETK